MAPENRADTLHWLDVDEIAEALHEAHMDVDPWRIRFTEMRRLVEGLANFREHPGHPCNERILEEIQAHWIALREGGISDDEDEDEVGVGD